jgi:putative redox protein
MVTISATYEGDLCCTATHGPSSAVLQTDAPKDNEGLGRFFSPTDLVATALATCILTTMGIVARRHGIELKGARLPAEITVTGTFTAAQRQLLENAAHGCPVHKSLHPDVDAAITFVWNE